jgi:uncharacterized protein YecT (DUF1311 family)
MNKLSISFLCAYVVSSSSAVAQHTRAAELAAADQKLNDVLRKISGKLNSEEKAKLIKAQHAWLIFRDIDCSWAFRAEPLDCLIDRTTNRTNELETTAFRDVNGRYGLIKD